MTDVLPRLVRTTQRAQGPCGRGRRDCRRCPSHRNRVRKSCAMPSRSPKLAWTRSQLSDLYSRIVTAHIFDNLYDYDHLARPFKIRPCTAAGMPEVSDDFRTFTVRISSRASSSRTILSSRERSANWSRRTTSTRWKRFFDPRWKAPAFATLNELKMSAWRRCATRSSRTRSHSTTTPRSKACVPSTATRCASASKSRSRASSRR